MKLSVVCGKKPASKEVQITNVTKEEMKEEFYECICYDGKLYHETYAGTTVEPEEYIGSVEETVEAGKIPAKNLCGNEDGVSVGDKVYRLKDDSEAIYIEGIWPMMDGDTKTKVYQRFALGANHDNHQEIPRFDSLNEAEHKKLIYYKGKKYERRDSVDIQGRNLESIGTLNYASCWENLYENQELYTTDPFRDVLGYEVFVDKDNEHRIYLDVEGYFYLYDFVETE
ncbi:MAG: hypothetical protein K6G65_03960 [Lachnospiraceae bacterium]|nr:hypothetical protein [Lachnospiraceae bacterium]